MHYANDEIMVIAREANSAFLFENAAATRAFPSVKRMQDEIVSMVLSVLHGGSESAGIVTAGGTESIMCAVHAARQVALRAGKPKQPLELLVPESAHPAFDKAAEWLGLKLVRAQLQDDYRADLRDVERLITETTIAIGASAPCLPFGVFDPIAEIAALASRRNLWFHVDACIGGFLAPFVDVETIIPPFDFSLPGISSISVDIHKYGFAPKGVSTLLLASPKLLEASPTIRPPWLSEHYGGFGLLGSRSAGPTAAAWAVMQSLGRAGYMRLTEKILQIALTMRSELHRLGFRFYGAPRLATFSYYHPDKSAAELARALRLSGWAPSTLNEPPGLHTSVSMGHGRSLARYIADLSLALST
jgi:glutamate/tyrosine decarboxylase-like PLP-dependent enzyme